MRESNLPPDALDRFREAVGIRLGLRFGDDRLPLLEEALSSRLRSAKCSVDDYLQNRVPALQELAELCRFLSVSETYFLRNRDQFDAFASLIATRAASGARRLRILSAACSTGEEPYSIAMVLREMLPDLPAWDVKITAFDINPESLEKARIGRYRAWALRETPEAMRRDCFRETAGDFELADMVRSMVTFELRNPVEPDPRFWRREAFDFIFCRNVLMYFTPEAMRETVHKLALSLSPDGYLFLGHAENLRGVSNEFHLRHSHGTFYYQRRSNRSGGASAPAIRQNQERATAPSPLPHDVSWFTAIAEASQRIHDIVAPVAKSESPSEVPPAPAAGNGSSFNEALELWKLDRFQDALAALATSADNDSLDPDWLLLQAMALVGKADVNAAMDTCGELLRIDELNAGAHYVMALCKEHCGEVDAAVEHDETAIYLDRQFAMPHLHLGLIARRANDGISARRELIAARELLAKEDAARIVLFGGGFGRDQLIALCDAELLAVEEVR